MLKKLLLVTLLFKSITGMHKVEKVLDDVYKIDFDSMDLQSRTLYYCYRRFIVEHNDKMVIVNTNNMDGKLKNITEEKLRKALKEGNITMIKIDLDKYHLRYNRKD